MSADKQIIATSKQRKDLRDILQELGPDGAKQALTDQRNLALAHDASTDGVALTADAFKTSNNDDGNARLFVQRWKHDSRHVTETKQWLLLKGGRWQPVPEEVFLERAKAISRELSALAHLADGGQDAKKAAFSRALSLGNGERLDKMLRLAKTDPEIRISVHELDQDTDLLGVANGILDLCTGKLLEETPYVTLAAVASYQPAAMCPNWERFMAQTFEGNEEIIPYLQQAAGLTLSGRMGHQCLWFLSGTGANGKSVFAEILFTLMGNYAVRVDDTILTIGHSQNPGPSLARLPGKRMILGSEAGEGKRMNEQAIKDITGGDTLKAEAKYCAPFDFRPVGKLWMFGNHKPQIRGTDEGIWRRFKLVNFSNTVPPERRNPELQAILKAELPGILNWCLAGYQQLIKQGYKITEPTSVKAATEEFRHDSDILAQFLAEATNETPGTTLTKRELWEHYVLWLGSERHAISLKAFSRKLKERGLLKESSERYWRDLSLIKLDSQGDADF
jgi:putative DNA primase/helicase